mgnify:CR=1 FL=1
MGRKVRLYAAVLLTAMFLNGCSMTTVEKMYSPPKRSAEYEDLQRYQDETGIQVIYPTVAEQDRPTMEKNKYDANIYYQVENRKASTIRPKLDKEGNIIPNYWKYEAGEDNSLIPEYNSLRIEGEDGIRKTIVTSKGEEREVTVYYAYGTLVPGGVEVRAEYYEYYTYLHTQVKK